MSHSDTFFRQKRKFPDTDTDISIHQQKNHNASCQKRDCRNTTPPIVDLTMEKQDAVQVNN